MSRFVAAPDGARRRRPPVWAFVLFGVLVLGLVVALLVVRPRPADVRTVYVSATGDDSADGTAPERAWATPQRAAREDLPPGSVVRLARGSRFTGPWTVAWSGRADAPVRIGSYGDGALPVLTGDGSCVRVTGSWVVVSEVRVEDCAYAGVEIAGDDVGVEAVEATGSVAGVVVATGADRARVTRNVITDNRRMSVLTREPDTDDAGAYGVLLNGRNAEVSYNTISGHHAFSYDFGEDGAGVEVYDSVGNRVHHNTIRDGSGIELGGAGTDDNTFSYNLITSERPGSVGLVTRGAADPFGPVRGTTVDHATIWIRGTDTQGVVCYGGCSPELLRVRNSIVVADRAVYLDGPATDVTNLFSGSTFGTVSSPVLDRSALRLTDPDGGDFTPAAGSPAVDAGTDLGTLSTPTDLRGTAVTGRPDIGAIERP